VVPVRADIANQAEGASIFGAATGSVRYVVDGFELDPLSAPTFDPSRLPLLGLEHVRIERRVSGATVYLQTLSPTEASPRTIIEAGAGDYDVQLFRGMFLAPSVLGGPLALGFERLAADGAIGGTSNQTTGWAKWSWVRDSTGLQIEYRQSDIERSGVEEGLAGLRRDWVVRGRGQRGPVTGEIYAGASRVEDARGDVLVREGTPQGGIRLRTSLSAPVPLDVRTAVRFRDHPRLPFGDFELALRALPLPLLALEVEAARQLWDEGAGTGSWTARAQAGPIAGVALFSEVFGGAPLLDDGLTLRAPFPSGGALQVKREGVRAGAEVRWRGASLLAAGLKATAEPVPAFGLAFEPSFPILTRSEATGYEVIARLPTGWDPLSINGWYVGLDAPEPWLYQPEHHWRAGLVYHNLPLPSGNLEIFWRLEHVFRGRMTVPGVPAEGTDPAALWYRWSKSLSLAEVGAVRETNFELAIRVISVQAFVRWDNVMNRRGQRDLFQLERPGQRILYGVKWEFVN
jgi:hypothetical protein